MKTGNDNKALGISLLALGLLLGTGTAWAADEGAPPAMEPSTASAVTLPSGQPVAGKNGSSGHSDVLHDTGVPDSVKSVIKNLNGGIDNITLDDLNAARQAVAKLDALIDIEKKLIDLDKLRHEQKKAENPSPAFVEAIPSSALGMPREAPPMPVARMPSGGSIGVARIEGSAGRYTAFIDEFGTTRPAHVGDHLTDGSTVLAITADGVELRKSGKIRLVRVKDVETVFGDLP